MMILKEVCGAFCATWLFLLPGSCIKAALKGGIVSDFGCWFWIDVDGLRVCRRHQQRSFCGWL